MDLAVSRVRSERGVGIVSECSVRSFGLEILSESCEVLFRISTLMYELVSTAFIGHVIILFHV